jgi:hypothetical protein
MRHGRPDYQKSIIDLRGLSAAEVAALWGEADRAPEDIGGPIPPDEPVFLIRGCDVAAPQAILAYAELAAEHGASDFHVESARAWASEVDAWQRAHQDRVKVPDRPGAKPEVSLGAVETTFSMSFPCDRCGGGVEVKGANPVRHKTIALSGVRCLLCGASYSLELVPISIGLGGAVVGVAMTLPVVEEPRPEPGVRVIPIFAGPTFSAKCVESIVAATPEAEPEPEPPPSLRWAAGQQLSNGATVLEAAPVLGGYIVLALCPGEPEPFATWLLSEGNVPIIGGERYHTLTAAMASYNRRRREGR